MIFYLPISDSVIRDFDRMSFAQESQDHVCCNVDARQNYETEAKHVAVRRFIYEVGLKRHLEANYGYRGLVEVAEKGLVLVILQKLDESNGVDQ